MVVIALELVSLAWVMFSSGILYVLQEFVKSMDGFVNHIHNSTRIHLDQKKHDILPHCWCCRRQGEKSTCGFCRSGKLEKWNCLPGLIVTLWCMAARPFAAARLIMWAPAGVCALVVWRRAFANASHWNNVTSRQSLSPTREECCQGPRPGSSSWLLLAVLCAFALIQCKSTVIQRT